MVDGALGDSESLAGLSEEIVLVKRLILGDGYMSTSIRLQK